MKKNTLQHNEEIDLIALFKIIWNGKIKILLISIISLLVAFGYSYQIPNNYINSITLNAIDTYELRLIYNIKKLTESNQFDQSNQLNTSNRSNELDELNKIILDKFIYELKDYEEFLFIINNTKKIKEDISQIKIQDQELALFKYAKLLEIVEPKKNEEEYTLNFIWNDTEEAKKYLQDILKLTSNNLKNKINNELVEALEFQKKLKLNNDRERLDYLREQSTIAKELNIVDNEVDNVNLSQTNLTLRINSADIPYYLRGYRAIDKEIELIQKRDYKYLKIIEKEINAFENADIKFVDFNVYLMDSKSLKNMKLILLLSIILGLIVGIFYVLVSNIITSQTSRKNKQRI